MSNYQHGAGRRMESLVEREGERIEKRNAFRRSAGLTGTTFLQSVRLTPDDRRKLEDAGLVGMRAETARNNARPGVRRYSKRERPGHVGIATLARHWGISKDGVRKRGFGRGMPPFNTLAEADAWLSASGLNTRVYGKRSEGGAS